MLLHQNKGVKMKELSEAFIEARLRSGKGTGPQASPVRSPLPVARRAIAATILAMDNSQIAEILNAEDVRAGR
jgi:hypothetical protein